MKINIYEILFWIFLVISLFLLAWYVIGDSPTDFAIIITLLFTLLLKMGAIGERLTRNEMKLTNLKGSFIRLASDFKEHVKHK